MNHWKIALATTILLIVLLAGGALYLLLDDPVCCAIPPSPTPTDSRSPHTPLQERTPFPDDYTPGSLMPTIAAT